MIIGIFLTLSGIISIIGGIILLAAQVLFLKMDVFGSLSEALPAGAIGLGFVLFMLGLEAFFRARELCSPHRDNGKESPLAPINDNQRVKVEIPKKSPKHSFRLFNLPY
jgi:hypothetical protein